MYCAGAAALGTSRTLEWRPKNKHSCSFARSPRQEHRLGPESSAVVIIDLPATYPLRHNHARAWRGAARPRPQARSSPAGLSTEDGLFVTWSGLGRGPTWASTTSGMRSSTPESTTGAARSPRTTAPHTSSAGDATRRGREQDWQGQAVPRRGGTSREATDGCWPQAGGRADAPAPRRPEQRGRGDRPVRTGRPPRPCRRGPPGMARDPARRPCRCCPPRARTPTHRSRCSPRRRAARRATLRPARRSSRPGLRRPAPGTPPTGPYPG